MRVRLYGIVLSALFLAGCRSDYEGESFPSVVEGNEVESVDAVPDDARIIGFVSDGEEHTIDGNSLGQQALYCGVQDRLVRQMKRTAADQGGEFLVAVFCEATETEDASSVHDDPETNRVETSMRCETYCEADVARRWIHDRG
ncbi:MAG: hypothetical protein KUG77_19415 [Nannocystaceae bacterium]|nr:hypothetical protein [Nannocystaceae bacterium]